MKIKPNRFKHECYKNLMWSAVVKDNKTKQISKLIVKTMSDSPDVAKALAVWQFCEENVGSLREDCTTTVEFLGQAR